VSTILTLGLLAGGALAGQKLFAMAVFAQPESSFNLFIAGIGMVMFIACGFGFVGASILALADIIRSL
jgi:hypothetical protein